VLDAVVTSKRDKATALKPLKRILKKYGRPRKIVTDGLCSHSAALKEVGPQIGTRWVAVSAIGRRIHTNRFDDGSGRRSGFEA
jgi:transposase-like protein